MLQIGLKTFASDALEDAMRLAQTKALNSYSWSDCLNYLNYAWMDMYQQIAFVDEGYYSVTMRLTKKLTKLPLCVKNTIKVYAAQTSNSFNREVFRQSGQNDLQGWNTYHISGFDLYCPDAERRQIWLNYVPQQPQIFFTMNNRDPKLYLDKDNLPEKAQITANGLLYNMWLIRFETAPIGESFVQVTAPGAVGNMKVKMVYRNATAGIDNIDITEYFMKAYNDPDMQHGIISDWTIETFICDYPYVFVTYKNKYTSECYSGFYKKLPNDSEFIEFNPFEYTGRNSNVEYIQAKWNDKTGLGVIVKDWNDIDEDNEPRIKELGWTPDTLLVYPGPEMYRLLVARLADKFAAMNESEMIAIQKELAEAEFAFKNFLGKNKSSWSRIDNVNGPSIMDWL
jgi:hypothetical protein